MQNVRFWHKADIAGFGLDHFQSGSLTRYDDLVRRNERAGREFAFTLLLEAIWMSAFHSKMTSFIVMSVVVILPNFSLAQSQTAPTQSDQPSRVSVVYVPPQNSAFQQLYDLLRERRALERIQEILSPLQLPEQLTIKTTECGAVNSYYQRQNFKPTVTICYELLKQIWIPSQTKPPLPE